MWFFLFPIVVIYAAISAILSATGHPGGLITAVHLNDTKNITESQTRLHPRSVFVQTARSSIHNRTGGLTVTRTESNIETLTATYLDFEIGPIEGDAIDPLVGSTISTKITTRTHVTWLSSSTAVPNPQPVQDGSSVDYSSSTTHTRAGEQPDNDPSTVPNSGVESSGWSSTSSFSTLYTQRTATVIPIGSGIEPDDPCVDAESTSETDTVTVIQTSEDVTIVTRSFSGPPVTPLISKSTSWPAPLTSTTTVTSTRSPVSEREIVGQERDSKATKLAKRCVSPTITLTTTSGPTINCTNIEGAWTSWTTSWSNGGEAVMSCAMNEGRDLMPLRSVIEEVGRLDQIDEVSTSPT